MNDDDFPEDDSSNSEESDQDFLDDEKVTLENDDSGYIEEYDDDNAPQYPDNEEEPDDYDELSERNMEDNIRKCGKG